MLLFDGIHNSRDAVAYQAYVLRNRNADGTRNMTDQDREM
jgi:hypothetical protein